MNNSRSLVKLIITFINKICLVKIMKKKGIKKEILDSEISEKEIEKKILENLVALQKVHTSLIEKFDNLAKQISSLLFLFEATARSFAQNPSFRDIEKDKEFLDKIDKLLEQNKLIAKGLTLMGERLKEKVYGEYIQNKEKGEEEIKETEHMEKEYIQSPEINEDMVPINKEVLKEKETELPPQFKPDIPPGTRPLSKF